MHLRRVIIVGAGPAGLSAWLALRAHGIDAQIFERASALRSVGTGLTLFPNGLAMLDKLHPGLAAPLIAAGGNVTTIHLWQPSGEPMFSTPVTSTERYGWPILNLRWSQLQDALVQHCPPEVMHFGHQLVGLEQTSEGVVAHFENGKQVEGELLLGADGIGSAVRRLTLKDGSPRYAGRMSWRGMIPYAHPVMKHGESVFMMSPQGKTFAAFDVGGGETFWSAGMAGPDELTPPDRLKGKLLQCFEGWAPLVGDLINATDAPVILERPILDRPPCPTWTTGRVTLMGDAAHPMVPSLGQGANTAFEDAWVLAQCLAAAPSLEDALAGYEAERIPRAQIIQARSARQGARAYDPDGEWYREGVSKAAELNALQFDHWLYSYAPRPVSSL